MPDSVPHEFFVSVHFFHTFFFVAVVVLLCLNSSPEKGNVRTLFKSCLPVMWAFVIHCFFLVSVCDFFIPF